MPSHKHRKIGLDYVRAFAITCVILCHFLIHYPRLFLAAAPFGVLGVEVFFVLSGFLIGGIFVSTLARDENRLTFDSVRRFWIRRWLRTLPLYLIFLGVFAWLDSMTVRQVLQYLVFAQNLTTPMPSQFNASWSLAVEEWFYLLLPLLTLGFATLLRDGRRALVVTIILMLGVPTLIRMTVGVGQPWDSAARRIVMMRLDAIMWGVLIAVVGKNYRNLYEVLKKPVFAGMGLVLVMLCTGLLIARFRESDHFLASRSDALILTGMSVGCALMFPRLAVFGGIGRRVDFVVLKISLWSYSMYLCHLPVMVFCSWAAKQVSWAPRGAYLGPVTLILIVATSGAIYHLVELPIMNLRDRMYPDTKRVPSQTQDIALPPLSQVATQR